MDALDGLKPCTVLPVRVICRAIMANLCRSRIEMRGYRTWVTGPKNAPNLRFAMKTQTTINLFGLNLSVIILSYYNCRIASSYYPHKLFHLFCSSLLKNNDTVSTLGTFLNASTYIFTVASSVTSRLTRRSTIDVNKGASNDGPMNDGNDAGSIV